MKIESKFVLSLLLGASGMAVSKTEKPNVIILLTDDQDLRMGSMDYMPKVKKYLTDEGLFFNHHYATVALCCPSRASLWTGKAAHNTKITDLAPPHGGYDKFIGEGYNKKWLPVWLQDAGYRTYYTGKLMNHHTVDNYKEGLGNMGLTGNDFFIEPGTYQYLNTTTVHNIGKPQHHPDIYATDLLTNLSTAWIDDAATEGSPFFLAINPVNPHNNLDWNNGSQRWTQPVPAERHKNKFTDSIVPRDPGKYIGNFNPSSPSGASWVRDLTRLDGNQTKEGDKYYRHRLQALQAVDDMVETIIERLEHHGMLKNTFFVYTSDNGFHIGQHRLTPGKRCPYEEDVNVPLVIRGPGVPKGKNGEFVTSHLDIAPTILDWVGAEEKEGLDGRRIPIHNANEDYQQWESVQIEHWGPVSSKQGVPDKLRKRGNTYKAARIIGPNYNIYYAVWCEGDHEIYDMSADPYQMNNLHNNRNTLLDVSMKELEYRLDALLLVMKTCSGKTCHQPWGAMHPDGSVKSLADALHPKYNQFYENQNRVNFEKCEAGYNVENEIPVEYHRYVNDTVSGLMGERDLDWWINAG